MHDHQPRNARLNLLLNACTVAIVVVAFVATAAVGILSKFAGPLA